MATLSADIDATQTVVPVTGTAPDTGSYFTVGSESIRFLGTSRGPGGRAPRRTFWSIDRGLAGTTAASHSSGATLTQYHPDAASSGGGGSISATDGTTTVDPATSIVFPSGTLADVGGGVASVGGFGLVHPATVSFDTPNITSDYVLVVALPVGTVVWGIRVDCPISFDGNRLEVLMTVSGSEDVIWSSVSNPGPSVSTRWVAGLGDDTNRQTSSGGVVGDSGDVNYPPGLYAYLDGGDPVTTGSADIYALVVFPA